MPYDNQAVTVSEFLTQTWDDYKSPTTSSFSSLLGSCKKTVSSFSDKVETDRLAAIRLKKVSKTLHASTVSQVSATKSMAAELQRLSCSSEFDQPVLNAYSKVSEVIECYSTILEKFSNCVGHSLLTKLETLLKDDSKDSKEDRRKGVDKALKDYETRLSKIEKERKQQGKEVGMIPTDIADGVIAEDVEKERRGFQYHMCDYLLSTKDLLIAYGPDLVDELLITYRALQSVFDEGQRLLAKNSAQMDALAADIATARASHETERHRIVELRDALQPFAPAGGLSSQPGGRSRAAQQVTANYNLHQLSGDPRYGSSITGYLLKRSEARIRRAWQRRRCQVKDGIMYVYHSDESKTPTSLNLLTCQMKLPDEKKCFDIVASDGHTYHFQTENENEMERWLSVLTNAKEAVLRRAFGEHGSEIPDSVLELRKGIIASIRATAGNERCADCRAADPDWLSTNLGVLICLECSGIHRKLGVHISRIRSLVIDDLGTAHLLIGRHSCNDLFNAVFESSVGAARALQPDSSMSAREEFIFAKYERRSFVRSSGAQPTSCREAVLTNDFQKLLQAYAEGQDLMQPLADGSTPLHLAIGADSPDSPALHLVDFISQNSVQPDRRDATGDTALHAAARANNTEAIKVLLRVHPDLLDMTNSMTGVSARQAADEHHNLACSQLLEEAAAGNKAAFENVNIFWNILPEVVDGVDVGSEDELTGDARRSAPRPRSCTVEDSLLRANLSPTSASTDSGSTSHGVGRGPRSRTLPGGGTGLFPQRPAAAAVVAPSERTGGGAGQHRRAPSEGNLVDRQVNITEMPPQTQSDHVVRNIVRKGALMVLPPTGGSEALAAVQLRKVASPPPHGASVSPPTGYRHQHSSNVRPSHDPTRALSPSAKRSSHPTLADTAPAVDMSASVTQIINSLNTSRLFGQSPVSPTRSSPLRSTSTNSDTFSPPKTEAAAGGGGGRAVALDLSSSAHAAASERRSMQPPPVAAKPKIDVRPMPRKKLCRALYNCSADEVDELSFAEGEIIEIERKENDEWWEGHVQGDLTRRGLFPRLYVELL